MSMQNDRELKSLIEGLLYVWGDPLPVKDLAEVLEIPSKPAAIYWSR